MNLVKLNATHGKPCFEASDELYDLTPIIF